MSLNKLTQVQKGLDLNFKIGCEELECKGQIITQQLDVVRVIATQIVDTPELKSDTINNSGTITTDILDADSINIGGQPVNPSTQHENVTQSQAVVSKIIVNTTTETSLLPVTSVGTTLFPANTLVVGDVINVNSWGTFSANLVPNTITIRMYTGPTGNVLTASSGAQSFGPGVLNETYHIEGCVVVRTAVQLVFTGWITITDFATKIPKVLSIGQQSSSINLAIDNEFTFTAQWSVADSQGDITASTYEIKKSSVKSV